jgi:putative ATPase
VKAGLAGPVPAHLRDAHYPGAGKIGHGHGYEYPHDFEGGIVGQDYAPEAIAGRRYYEPSQHGAEARYAERAERIRAILAQPGGSGRSGQPAQPGESGRSGQPGQSGRAAESPHRDRS